MRITPDRVELVAETIAVLVVFAFPVWVAKTSTWLTGMVAALMVAGLFAVLLFEAKRQIRKLERRDRDP